MPSTPICPSCKEPVVSCSIKRKAPLRHHASTHYMFRSTKSYPPTWPDPRDSEVLSNVMSYIKPSEFLYISVIIVIIFILTERVEEPWIHLCRRCQVAVQWTCEPRSGLVRKQTLNDFSAYSAQFLSRSEVLADSDYLSLSRYLSFLVFT